MTNQDRLNQQIDNVEKWPRQTGKADYLRHLHGERLTKDEAIKAKCLECVCAEDTEECQAVFCPLQQNE